MSTFFPFPDLYLENFKKKFSIEPSKEFISCADQQLINSFELQTGLKATKRMEIGWADEPSFFYTLGPVSKLASMLWINNQNSPITIAWQSTSAKIYKITDTIIDCDDIKFWFEDTMPELYYKQLHPQIDIPFGIKDLNFPLTIESLTIDMSIEMYLKEDAVKDGKDIITKIDKFIDDYNTASEKKDRRNGVVHNWKRELRENVLIYDFDLGSAGLLVVKKLIGYLSKLDLFIEVKIV